MIKRLLFSMLVIPALFAQAQTLRKYEYWIDSDYSKHVSVNNNKEEISFSISTSNQSEGVHFLNFRAQNTDNDWGSISRYLYYIPEKLSATPTVAGYECWIDGDYSNKTSVKGSTTQIASVIDISQLPEGVHFYNFRAINSDNVCGNLYRYLFYVPEKTSVNPTLSGYEYWLDGDYSKHVRSSSTLGDVSMLVDISSLTEGVHFLNFRAKNSDNVWGNLYRYLFYVPERTNPVPKLNGYEYWLDEDYSQRKTSVSSLGDVNLMIDISMLEEGVHFLNFRAKNSDGVHSDIKRYLFYVPSKESLNKSPIVGYRYGFNSKSIYVSIAERTSFELNNLIIPLPSNVECANIEDGTFSIDEKTNRIEMKRTAKISFFMQFKNKDGNWSCPEVEEFVQSDTISKSAMSLAVQKQVSFNKVQAGDFEVVKLDIPTSRTYYFKSSQSCDMQLYHNGSKIGNRISGKSLKETYNIGLDAGTYYAVLYNMVKDSDNTANNVVLKLMLTDNITPTPVIKFIDGMVTITCDQDGAAIYYTLDGNEPSASSIKYTAPFKLTHNAVIKAVAMYTDLAESNIATYRVDSYKVIAPKIEFANLKVYISSETPGAKLYYTIDGSSPDSYGNQYSGPVEINRNCTVKAVAKLDGYNNSDISSKYIDVDNVTCVVPTFNLSGNKLSIKTLTDGATIYYTTDGTTPSTGSVKYVGAISLTRNCTVKAIAVKSGQITSPVASFVVDIYKTATPTFSFAQNILSVFCSTPNAVIYYTLGTEQPTETSQVYSRPIVLHDNRQVNVIAVAEGFNISDMATYTPTSFKCDNVAIGYDGRTITMSAQDDVTVYYTMDGSNPTISSAIYDNPIRLDGLCTIKAMAVKEYMNNSDVTTYETPCFYDGGLLKMAQAGNLYKAFEWCGIENIDDITVVGPVNDADLKFVGTIPSLRCADLSAATIKGNELANGIFANSNFRSIILPGTLTKCGNNIFTGNKRLCAVKWNANIVIPSGMFGGISNPNLLLYVNSKSYAPSSLQNVVVNQVAESIVLHDGYDFYACHEFRANMISYTRNFSMRTIKGVCRGWESIALPFTVTKYIHETNGPVAPFAKNVTGAKPFWLYELDETEGFVKAKNIEANKPYIISMPNNSDYADDYVLGGDITFVGENVIVPATTTKTVRYGSFTFTPSFGSIGKASDIYPINVKEEYNGYPEGSLFVSQLRDVRPFESYMRSNSESSSACVHIFDDIVDAIDDVISSDNSISVWCDNRLLYINSSRNQTVWIYSQTGQIVMCIDVHIGQNVISGLPDGIYIVNGIKVCVL